MLATNEKIDFKNKIPLQSAVCCITHQEAHFHENAIEMLIVLKGTIHMRSSHRHVSLHKGDTFTMDPGDIHCIYSDVDNLVLILHQSLSSSKYSPEHMNNCFFACESQHISPQQKKALYRVSDLMLSAGLEYTKTNHEISEAIISDISESLLDALINNFDWLSFMWDPNDSNPILQERFHRIIAYCQSNYREKISISMLAKKEHFNENYFSTLMKKTSFEGFGYMLNFFRCDGAERLLLTCDKSIVEISALCGFSDPKYFYKHFRKWWNMSPAKLRQWYREYAQADVQVQTLTPAEAHNVLKDYLAEYHIRRCLEM